jgi:hypothetical protein
MRITLPARLDDVHARGVREIVAPEPETAATPLK